MELCVNEAKPFKPSGFSLTDFKSNFFSSSFAMLKAKCDMRHLTSVSGISCSLIYNSKFALALISEK